MSTWRKGYKVVSDAFFSEEDNRRAYKSYIVPRFGAGRVYEVGKITVPQPGCGPLCVFKTLKSAKKFTRGSDPLIFSCLYSPSKKKVVHNGPKRLPTSNIVKLGNLPWSTALATRVVLKKEVQ
jgi:hypothetical protein